MDTKIKQLLQDLREIGLPKVATLLADCANMDSKNEQRRRKKLDAFFKKREKEFPRRPLVEISVEDALKYAKREQEIYPSPEHFRWMRTAEGDVFGVPNGEIVDALCDIPIVGRHLQTNDILKTAESPDSPLHKLFDWSMDRDYRCEQADRVNDFFGIATHMVIRAEQDRILNECLLALTREEHRRADILRGETALLRAEYARLKGETTGSC